MKWVSLKLLVLTMQKMNNGRLDAEFLAALNLILELHNSIEGPERRAYQTNDSCLRRKLQGRRAKWVVYDMSGILNYPSLISALPFCSSSPYPITAENRHSLSDSWEPSHRIPNQRAWRLLLLMNRAISSEIWEHRHIWPTIHYPFLPP
jgi:hypothetical protein